MSCAVEMCPENFFKYVAFDNFVKTVQSANKAGLHEFSFFA